MGNGYRHYAGLKGSKEIHVGADADIYNYTDLEAALAAVQPNDVLHIHDGTYSLTGTATIDHNLSVYGHGHVTINGGSSGIADRLFMLNVPASGSADVKISFHNIDFVNANSTADVFEIDNDGGASSDLYVKFRDCSFDAGASGLSFDVDQSTNTQDVFLSVSARLADRKIMEGLNLDLSKAGSLVDIEGYDFGASVAALGTTNVAWVFSIINCQYESAAFTSGGSASVIFNAHGCSKVSSGALVAPVVEDFDATSASENVQVGTLDV